MNQLTLENLYLNLYRVCMLRFIDQTKYLYYEVNMQMCVPFLRKVLLIARYVISNMLSLYCEVNMQMRVTFLRKDLLFARYDDN